MQGQEERDRFTANFIGLRTFLVEKTKKGWELDEWLAAHNELQNMMFLLRDHNPVNGDNRKFGLQNEARDNLKYWNELRGPGYEGLK